MRPSRHAIGAVVALLLLLFLGLRARSSSRPGHDEGHPPERAAPAPPEERGAEPPPAKPTFTAPAATAAPRGPETTILVLEAAPAGYRLVTFADKHYAWPGADAAGPGTSEARARIEDANGKVLLETTCAVPRLCRCKIGHDHALGCGVIRHEAVFRVKLPRLAEHEKLVLVAADGSRELGRFDLSRTP